MIFRAHPPYPASSSPRAQFRKGSDPVDKEKGAQGRLRTQTRTVDVKMLFNVVTLTPRFESLWFMLQRINPEKKKKKGRALPHSSGNCKVEASFWKLGMKGSVKGISPTPGNIKSTQELLLLSFRNNPRRHPWPVYPSSLLLSQKGKKISTRIQTSLFSGCQLQLLLD